MNVAPELVQRFRTDLAALWPFLENETATLGIAVSGGGDSLALLLLANAALPGRIEAATVDHQLRSASRAEAEHVEHYCEQLGVPHETRRVEITKGNLQDRARHARYATLGAWCEARGLDGLATGHQLDDQLETFMMRLNRGSGLSGLAGVRALGTVPDASVRLVRPLLGWTRAELAGIVRKAGWEAVCDPSNEDTAFDRVRIRNALATAHWIDPIGVARSARLLAEADETLEWAVGREYIERVASEDEAKVYRALRTGVGGTLIHGGVIRTIYRSFGLEIGRAEAADLVTTLRQGRKSNVAGLQADIRDDDAERVWVFRPENPRRDA